MTVTTDIQSFLNTYINISGSPTDILVNVILPIPVLAYAIYLVLGEMKFFKSPSVRALLGIVMAVSAVLVLKLGSLALWGGFAGILLLRIKNWPGRLVALGIFVLIMSQIFGLNLTNLTIGQVLLLGASIIALFALAGTDSFKMQLLIVAIVFVAYFVILTYLLPQIPISTITRI